MLLVRKALKHWCSKQALSLKDIAPFHKILGFKISELEKHCAKIEEVSGTPFSHASIQEPMLACTRIQASAHIPASCFVARCTAEPQTLHATGLLLLQAST